MTARLSHIQVFPFKSLDPMSLDPGTVLPTGALQHDRRYALVDTEGRYINGKRTPLVHRIRARFDADKTRLTVEIEGQVRDFEMGTDQEALEAWLSSYFAMPVQVREDVQGGFPDDLNAPGPTIISTATLETVASWFPGLTVDEVRLRFRANLEIGGVEPFWEDRLYAEKGQVVQLRVGDVLLEGVNPCQRCVVPSRNPKTAEALPNFPKTFAERRQQSLPSWAAASRFNHFYRLAVNTRLAPGEAGGSIKLNDVVEIVGIRVGTSSE